MTLNASALYRHVMHYFFESISARGFGLLRLLWGLTALIEALGKLGDVTRYYTNEGILPLELGDQIFRSSYRFTILEYIQEPELVFVLYCAYLAALFLTTVGIWTRASLIVSVILMASFHERNLLPLAGGDTVLRCVGFLLVVAPHINCFSLSRFLAQLRDKQFDPHPVMPIWPLRLLFWQLFLIYGTTLWIKSKGTMWLDGTAVGSVFHHEHFPIWPRAVMDTLSILSPIMSHGAMFFFVLWVLLLIPRSIRARLAFWKTPIDLKQFTLLLGVLFHGGIFVTMHIGLFPLIMISSYAGLLVKRDFHALRRLFFWKRERVFVLYDGNCGLCIRSKVGLQIMDWFGCLEMINFRKAAEKKSANVKITLKDLDRSMHIKTSGGRIENGFDAFRLLTWHLPILWWLIPCLYIPGVPPIGRQIYARIAASRNKCSHGACNV